MPGNFASSSMSLVTESLKRGTLHPLVDDRRRLSHGRWLA
jgi:hypothetical protein